MCGCITAQAKYDFSNSKNKKKQGVTHTVGKKRHKKTIKLTDRGSLAKKKYKPTAKKQNKKKDIDLIEVENQQYQKTIKQLYKRLKIVNAMENSEKKTEAINKIIITLDKLYKLEPKKHRIEG